MQNRQCNGGQRREGWPLPRGKQKKRAESVPARRLVPFLDNGEQNATPGYGSNYDGDPRTTLAFSAPRTPCSRTQTFFFSSIHYDALDNWKASQFTGAAFLFPPTSSRPFSIKLNRNNLLTRDDGDAKSARDETAGTIGSTL